jgi:iron complex outermembrane receptor protein
VHLRQLTIPLLTLLPLLAAAGGKQTPERHAAATAAVAGTAGEEPAAADTVIVVDKVQVTAIKQGMVLRSQPVAATIVGSRAIERERIGALKHLSQQVPNFYAPDYGSRMTSSIYVRGLGARIDQPVMGLNIDNVPVLNKDNYDTELADAERIEVLRGPQSTLYGRNTMGGVINVYTLSPLSYEGVRLSAEYGSGDSYKFRASSYYKLTPDLGMAVTGYYTHTGGFFENLATGDKCDWERLGGGRWKTQWRSRTGLRIDNTLSFSVLEQGGYPYAYVGDDIIGDDGRPVVRRGEIRYNDPCSYRRTALSDGLTIRYDAGSFTVASITSYQYSDDEMILDQDFLPLSYFTLRQARTEHSVTEDLVFRSRGDKAYRWLLGAFGFYRHGTMNAPVHFKQTGIEELILKYANENDQSYRYSWGLKDGTDGDELFLGSDFRMPSAGGALYHESNYTLGRWRFTAGLRFDFEHARLRYRNHTDTRYTKTRIKDDAVYELQLEIDDRSTLKQTFTELLPKFSVMYSFDETRNLYLTIAKGYKSGGFNTQIFSDVLQQKMMNRMGIGEVYDVQRGVAYKPEYSWNYEIGGHFSCMEGAVRGDFALFYIDCRDQQLTVFPPGQTTGRMMTNAGRTRSLGAEAAVQISPWRTFDINLAYGYTDARFVRYETTVKNDDGDPVRISYKDNRIPYAPQHTLSAGAAWTVPTGVKWLGDLVFQAGVRCAGRIWWNEENTLSQPFYALTDASVRFEHARYSLSVWGRNLADTGYDVFYFKSIGNEFVQRGRPRTFGITLNINL